MSLHVDAAICPQNHRCPLIKICPVQAISQDGYGLPLIDENKCIECARCLRSCPMHAISRTQ